MFPEFQMRMRGRSARGTLFTKNKFQHMDSNVA